MTTPEEPTPVDERKLVFGAALRDALAARGWKQIDLARAVGRTSQGGMSGWLSGAMPNDPDLVFQVERALDLPSGSLSKHLGYVPVDVTTVTADVVEAINGDPALDKEQRRHLIGIYESLTSHRLPPPSSQRRRARG